MTKKLPEISKKRPEHIHPVFSDPMKRRFLEAVDDGIPLDRLAKRFGANADTLRRLAQSEGRDTDQYHKSRKRALD